jgi:hypothetical protein
MYTIRVDDSLGTLSWADSNLNVTTSIRLRGNMDVEVDTDSNEPVSIRVDRSLYDIEVFDDRIEIRRRFDDESNDNGAHDESTGDSVQRSEDMLQQWDSEQNSQG